MTGNLAVALDRHLDSVTFEEVVKGADGFSVHGRGDVAVKVERDSHLGVAEQFGHHLRVDPLPEQQRRRRRRGRG